MVLTNSNQSKFEVNKAGKNFYKIPIIIEVSTFIENQKQQYISLNNRSQTMANQIL